MCSFGVNSSESRKSEVTRRAATCGVNSEVCFSGDVFGNPRDGSFVDPTNSVLYWLYGCACVIVCYESIPMVWGTKIR